jgi:hypothetical protein
LLPILLRSILALTLMRTMFKKFIYVINFLHKSTLIEQRNLAPLNSQKEMVYFIVVKKYAMPNPGIFI